MKKPLPEIARAGVRSSGFKKGSLWKNGYHRTFSTFFLFELDHSIGESEKGVVLPDPHVLTRMVLGSPLPDDDVPCFGALSTIKLHAEPFANGIPSVICASLSFLVCHVQRF